MREISLIINGFRSLTKGDINGLTNLASPCRIYSVDQKIIYLGIEKLFHVQTFSKILLFTHKNTYAYA